MTFYAHSTDGDKSEWQTIHDHLSNTAKLALLLGRDSGVEQYAYAAAMLHDIGKYSQAFQKRLEGASYKVDHSTAGAKEIRQLFQDNPVNNLVGEMLAYCIAGHHGGLLDYGSPVDVEADRTLTARLKKPLEDYSAFRNEISLLDLVLPPNIPIKPTTRNGGFSLSFFTRMIYSILVDADFQETETFMNGGTRPRGGFDSPNNLLIKLEQRLVQFGQPTTTVNQRREETLKECIVKAKEVPGLFTLTVPTGGGKTLSSLAFALTHAIQNNMRRVIYIIPYTTIIEQNAAVFKDYLGEENVLEHHSNFDWETLFKSNNSGMADDLTNLAAYKLKLSAENWDVPVVVTTNVQFFESLFSNRSSRSRKIHNLANSVLIFDEAQMLPREYLDPCMKAVYELVKNYRASAIFCTATQPSLGRFFPAGTNFTELSKDPLALYECYKRVKVVSEGKLSDVKVTQRLNEKQQVLCIVNTRRHAKGLFDGLSLEGRFHLSTLMCPAHRKITIRKIRDLLSEGKTCRVISTQIMEAGIDVDFPVGYRSLAGLDSIIQAAGRVNREGNLPIGYLHVFEPESKFIKRTPAYIAQAAAIANDVLRQFKEDPICLEAIKTYYESLYRLQDPHAFDTKRIMDCFEKDNPGNVEFDFETAAKNFRLIEENTVAVVIPFDPNVNEVLADEKLMEKPYLFLRKLQPYTVNIYENEFNALQGKGVIRFVNENIPVLLDKDYYDPETGVVLPDDTGGEGIVF